MNGVQISRCTKFSFFSLQVIGNVIIVLQHVNLDFICKMTTPLCSRITQIKMINHVTIEITIISTHI